VRDTQLGEDAHRYRERNGVQILATLRSMGLNTMRLAGMDSIANGMASVGHDIRHLLELLGWRSPDACGYRHETSHNQWGEGNFDQAFLTQP
jgi:hypothetical protein